MVKSFIYTAVLGLGMLFHPFHVSVCDIEYNAESKALEISHRIFMDDLEVGLKKFHNLEYVDAYKPKDPANLDSLVNLYIIDNLNFKVNDKAVTFKFIGSEIEGDARWCYLEVTGIESVKQVTIFNSTLTESFEDQENLVHIKANGKLKSYRLNKGEKQTTLTW